MKRRFVSWNIRAGGGRRTPLILEQLLAWRPHTIGLCEFRGTASSRWLANELAASGYHHQLCSVNPKQPARNALLLASRNPLQAIDNERQPRNPERWLLARQQSKPALIIGLMHVPNYTTPKRKYPFLSNVLRMIGPWQLGPALLVGDTNCGKRELDEEKPQGSKFRREHDWLVGIEKRGWADAFRHLHGNRREYTWYSHRNNGFRLDYAFTSPGLTPALTRLRHAWARDPAQPGRRDAVSDHAALIIELDDGAVNRDA